MSERVSNPTTTLFIVVVLLLAGSVTSILFTPVVPASEIAAKTTGYRIDLNHADAAELQLLPGIGAIVAEHVAEHRETEGRFAAVEELENVRMIGPIIRKRVKPYVALK